jgi:hypothetical protein
MDEINIEDNIENSNTIINNNNNDGDGINSLNLKRINQSFVVDGTNDYIASGFYFIFICASCYYCISILFTCY